MIYRAYFEEMDRKIQEAGVIHLEIRFCERMPHGVDAVAEYDPDKERYIITIGPVPGDWKKRSSRRRINFTLAHELAHIFCGHLIIPREMKTGEQLELEELEADEFAGRLLMPERLILNSQFSSLEELSAAFWVSDQAAFIRLNNLKRLDLIRLPRRAACCICGNDHVSPAAEYCEICGTLLEGRKKKGVQVVEYRADVTDETGRPAYCPVCGNQEYSPHAAYCRICGLPAYNVCTGERAKGLCRHINAVNARYCELCGSVTEYRRRKLLRDWEQEKADYVRWITKR